MSKYRPLKTQKNKTELQVAVQRVNFPDKYSCSFEYLKKHAKIPILKKGNTIGITCPAGLYALLGKAQTCITALQQWGFTVMVGKTLGSNSANYFPALMKNDWKSCRPCWTAKSLMPFYLAVVVMVLAALLIKLGYPV